MKRYILYFLVVFLSLTTFAQKKSSKKINKDAYELKMKHEWEKYLVRVRENNILKLKLKAQKDSIERITPKKDNSKCTENAMPFFVKIDNLGNMEEIPFSDFFQTHVINNFIYPEFAMNHNIQGKVMISFTIDKNGDITNIEANGPFNGLILEEEAVRIVQKIPRLIPARCDNEYVSTRKSIPIIFNLK